MTASTCGTEVVWRNMRFVNVQTRDFRHEVVMDESNTDALYHNVSIKIETLLAEDSEQIGPAINGSIADKVAFLRRSILQPRGEFQLSVEGRLILRATSQSGFSFTDVNNGPKPRDLSIIHIAGYKSFRITFTIDVALVFCDSSGGFATVIQDVQKNPKVLNNRWSIQESRDATGYMTRQITGLLRVSHSDYWPHLFRHLCMPPKLVGWQRKSMEFVQSTDGLKLNYTVMDRQRYAAPPWPAIDWYGGSHTERVTASGALASSTVTVGLQGAPGTPKTELLKACSIVVEDRLGDLRRFDTSKAWVDSAQIVDHFDENIVELTVDVRRKEAGERLFNMIYDKIGLKPQPKDAGQGSEEGKDGEQQPKEADWPNPVPYDPGTPAGMFATYLQNPCDDAHGFPFAITEQRDAENEHPETEESDTTDIAIYEGAPDSPTFEFSDDFDNVSREQREFPYVEIELESKYVFDQGLMVQPVAGTSSTGRPLNRTVHVSKLHHEICHNEIWMRVKRAGRPPAIPPVKKQRVDQNGIDMWLLTKEVVPAPRELMPMGNDYFYQVELYLKYVMARPPAEDEKLSTGSLPWDTTDSISSTYRLSENEDEGII